MDILIVFIAEYLVFVSAAAAVVFFLCQPRQKQKEILAFALIFLPVSYVAAKIVSRFYFNPRPFVIGNFTPLIPHMPDNGFPSDHTLLGVALAFAIFRFNKKIGSFLLVLAILVGAARVLAGVHHAVDIAGCVIIALVIYLLLKYPFDKFLKNYFTKNC